MIPSPKHLPDDFNLRPCTGEGCFLFVWARPSACREETSVLGDSSGRKPRRPWLLSATAVMAKCTFPFWQVLQIATADAPPNLQTLTDSSRSLSVSSQLDAEMSCILYCTHQLKVASLGLLAVVITLTPGPTRIWTGHASPTTQRSGVLRA